MATMIYNSIPKKLIPETYLTVAHFGWSMNGVIQACKRLNYNLDDLSVEQAASLIARLKYPESEIPSVTKIIKIENRKQHILKLLKVWNGQFRIPYSEIGTGKIA